MLNIRNMVAARGAVNAAPTVTTTIKLWQCATIYSGSDTAGPVWQQEYINYVGAVSAADRVLNDLPLADGVEIYPPNSASFRVYRAPKQGERLHGGYYAIPGRAVGSCACQCQMPVKPDVVGFYKAGYWYYNAIHYTNTLGR